jgi:energy-coupling factor transporter transmembrane protein EcfT
MESLIVVTIASILLGLISIVFLAIYWIRKITYSNILFFSISLFIGLIWTILGLYIGSEYGKTVMQDRIYYGETRQLFMAGTAYCQENKSEKYWIELLHCMDSKDVDERIGRTKEFISK